MAEGSMAESQGDEALDLERVAVGPYCVFDNYRPPPPSPPPFATGLARSRAAPSRTAAKMNDPLMPNEFGFGGFRPPWVASCEDDVAVSSASQDPLTSDSGWEEWMGWDPNASQDPKLNVQGPLCLLKANQRPNGYNPPQSSSQGEPAIGSTANSMPAKLEGVPFTFGGNIPNPTAFQFEQPLGSPQGSDPPSSGTLFNEPTMWNSTQPIPSGEQFSPLAFGQQQTSGLDSASQSTPSLQHSPNSAINMNSNSPDHSSPEPVIHSACKKRKPSSDEETIDFKSDKQPVKKTAHNMIEKRYRTNLNDKISALRDSVPSLRIMTRNSNGDEDDPEDLEGLTPAHKLNKATVLSKATEYIRHLEKRVKRQQDELSAMKSRLEHFEKLAMTNPMAIPGAVNGHEGMRFSDDAFGSPAAGVPVSQSPAQGMIPVPQSVSNMHRNSQPLPNYAEQQGYPMFQNQRQPPMAGQPHMMAGQRGPNIMNKFMVGSLAGIMLLEGMREREESAEDSSGRGLFAVPTSLLGRGFAGSLYSFSNKPMVQATLPLLKMCLLLGAFVYLVFPILSSSFGASGKKKAVPTIRLTPAPSLASPVEVRRKAWLTAIQTIWVPQHSFLLEAAALSLKTLKLSTRKLIGWNGYALLTGITKEQETARVKAWEIALDAQLMGGDAEISMSRLVLTLMASGTLPDTPARLMLKALHIRVLFWEVAKAGYGTWYMFDALSGKLARSYWNAARSEYKMANSRSKSSSQGEALSEHLAALLELEADEVLLDNIILRAYNVAWNKPTSTNTDADETMDGVVEDFAISSPLDALASWWSTAILNQTLKSHVWSKNKSASQEVMDNIKLALRTAPPASHAQVRALVARAVLNDAKRDSCINAALKALPSQPLSFEKGALDVRRALLMNAIGEEPISSDIRLALSLSKCLSVASHSNQDVRRQACDVVNAVPISQENMSLLSFVAAFGVLNRFSADEYLLDNSKQGLERIAWNVRVWVGRDCGCQTGMSKKMKTMVVDTCVRSSAMLVGMKEDADLDEESDAGYASQSSADADH
ncbi:hypothetical protein BDY21DRAFT_10257 [Lineolata rhizophorae]|uniref:BHLH domain-containing protein n=1 Tax=Lineolata rhizophorae TaxID=578093 RepID=A0A6A6PE18_9PEZI|nr:hypothetical protein BDY21DRAFT_10257 [Lineolata rhizophorae]